MSLLDGAQVQKLLADAAERAGHYLAGLDDRPVALVKELAIGMITAFPHGLYIGMPVGVVAGIVRILPDTHNIGAAFKAGLPVALIATLIFGLMTGLLRWAAVPLPEDMPQGPRDTLRRDVKLIYAATAAAIVVAAAGIILGFWFPAWRTVLIIGAPTVWFAVWLAALSPGYIVALLLLWTRRRVPREMMRFLSDAHRVGLLRQVGPIYQFRHADIQDHLARQYQARHESASGWTYGA